jgi:hypothetical protein
MGKRAVFARRARRWLKIQLPERLWDDELRKRVK